ncbi:helix-turn-helix domain-containing protein [Escherichia coli]|uniref:helix-turn-helix domain-containing protein n=1 Tax=Escherichia coli TaxID=562 RepID=UPI001C403405|nr:helix-turn-helix domain-containing protein [Escherichia coli]
MTRETSDSTFFSHDRKESIQDRIKQLVGSRSLRKATSDWGLPYSTINNYFEKGTTPGLNVVATIAKIENVPLEWLVYGEKKDVWHIEKQEGVVEKPNCTNVNIVDEMLKRALPEDRERLIDILCCIGIKGVLERLQQPTMLANDVPQTQEPVVHGCRTLEEPEEEIKHLHVSESLKEIFNLILVLAGNEQKEREILQVIKSCGRTESPGSNATTPDQEVNNVGKKSA